MTARFRAGESISALARDYEVSRASVMRIVKPVTLPVRGELRIVVIKSVSL
jgi:Mor family transcriptional regulator